MASKNYQDFVKMKLAKCNYKDDKEARKGIFQMLDAYPSFMPKVDKYEIRKGVRKELLFLDGSLSFISKDGNKSHVPLCLWLLRTYPHDPPLVFIKSAEDIIARPSKLVHSSGQIFHPYLRSWKFPDSNLTEFLMKLSEAFKSRCPILSSFVINRFKKYPHRKLFLPDILNNLEAFSYLDLKGDSYVFPNGTEKDLLCLVGTVPAIIKEMRFNIPICIWLLENHPYTIPLVYVRPTRDMYINSSPHVDNSGMVYHPYLHDWKFPSSNLFVLLQILCGIFSKMPPVISKPTTQPQSGSRDTSHVRTSNQGSTPTSKQRTTLDQNHPKSPQKKPSTQHSPSTDPKTSHKQDVPSTSSTTDALSSLAIDDEDVEELKDKLTCPICLHKERDTVFQCGHTTCEDCGKKLKECPMCRVAIVNRIHFYR